MKGDLAAADSILRECYGPVIEQQIRAGWDLIVIINRDRYRREVERLGACLDGWL